MPRQNQPNPSPILLITILLLPLLSPLVLATTDSPQTNLQPQRCTLGLTNGDLSSPTIHSCVCYPGYPNPVRAIKLPNGGKTLYDIPAIIKQGCAKFSTFEFGPEPYALEVSETVENTHKGEFGYFGEDVFVGVKFWREAAGQGCNESRKLGQEECEKDSAEVICDQGNGVSYGKCLEWKLYLDPSNVAKQVNPGTPAVAVEAARLSRQRRCVWRDQFESLIGVVFMDMPLWKGCHMGHESFAVSDVWCDCSKVTVPFKCV